MTKKEKINGWLQETNNINYIFRNVDLYLDNNYGGDIQYLYSLVDTEEKELGGYYRPLQKKEITILKGYICKSFIDVIKDGLNWDGIEASESTIKNTLKMYGWYTVLTTRFLNELNGEIENIDILKEAFKKYYKGV